MPVKKTVSSTSSADHTGAVGRGATGAPMVRSKGARWS